MPSYSVLISGFAVESSRPCSKFLFIFCFPFDYQIERLLICGLGGVDGGRFQLS